MSVDAALIAIISPISALAGVLLSQLIEVHKQHKGAEITIKHKLIDKRIEAVLVAYELCVSMVTHQGKSTESHNKEIVYPHYMEDEESFVKWTNVDFNNAYRNHLWLPRSITRELNLIQKYNQLLVGVVRDADATDVCQIGHDVRKDYEKMSEKLRKEIEKYISSEVTSLSLKDIRKEWAYDSDSLTKKLKDTVLFKEYLVNEKHRKDIIDS